MASLQTLMPDVSSEEYARIAAYTGGFNEDQQRGFATAYLAERKKPSTIFWLTFFFGGIGIHHFLLGKTGMGVLYIFTGGLLAIGWLIDIFRSKKLTLERNSEIARTIAAGMR